MKYFKFIYCLFLVFVSQFGFGQTLSSSLSSSKLALGEVGEYQIKIDNLQRSTIAAPPKNEALPFHFEILNDSIAKDDTHYYRLIKFQVFEEGHFKIPALEIKIGDQYQQTIPYDIEVTNTAKKDDVIHDIMNNKQVNLGVKDYWELYKLYILGILALMGLLFLIVYFIKYGRKKQGSPKVTSNQTLKELDLLRKKKYAENGQYRLYYVELIEITRDFLTRQYNIPANVLLTDDLIDYMKSTNIISESNEQIVQEIFQRGDLVKFAKIIPDTEIMDQDWSAIRKLVISAPQDIAAEQLRSIN